MEPVRFALFAHPIEARAAFEEMALGIHNRAGLALQPVYVSSYAGLAQALEGGYCDAAWSPPLVADDLLTSNVGRPLAAVGRGGRTTYYAALVTCSAEGRGDVRDLAGLRVGWVSKLSAAGYVIPTMYLKSLGIDPGALFARESFLGSHDGVLRALEEGTIDVGATYATIAPGGRSLVLPAHAPAFSRIAVAAGPIPGDVIFASSELAPGVRDRLRDAFLAMRIAWNGPLARLMSVDRFESPRLDHFETLRRWRTRAVESESRLPAAG